MDLRRSPSPFRGTPEAQYVVYNHILRPASAKEGLGEKRVRSRNG